MYLGLCFGACGETAGDDAGLCNRGAGACLLLTYVSHTVWCMCFTYCTFHILCFTFYAFHMLYCLGDKSEDYQNCSVLYCIPQLYTVISAHI